MKVIITSPSLDIDKNISGISSVARFIIGVNKTQEYTHVEIGRRDNEGRNLGWLGRILNLYFKWLVMLFKREDVIIHFNTALCRLAVLRDFPLILLTRIFRKTIIVHLHGGDYLMDNKPPLWMELIGRVVLSGSVPVIIQGPSEEATVKKRFGCKKTFILPNCIDLKEAGEFKRSYPWKGITLLFLGRISIDKGLEYIYKAAGSLKARKVDFKFVMAGKGPDEKVYRRKFGDLLGESFEFSGVVSGPAKTELLKRCNVFILPSFYEGLPMALLESMSFGLVPITTCVGSIGEIISDGINGIFVKTHSSLDIESAIEKLLKDEDYRYDLSKNARQSILGNFKAESYMDKLNTIYRQK